MTEHAQRLYHATCLGLHRLVEEYGASPSPLMREAMELTACLYVAEWLAARACTGRGERSERSPSPRSGGAGAGPPSEQEGVP